MKHLYRILLPTALLLGLLLAPAAALAAARDAAALWWARVFPALTPYLLVCGLLEGGWRGRRGAPGRWGLVPIFLFGAVGGYPAGAKLLGGLALPAEDARRMAIFCNLCSPGFLLSIIALGSYGDKRIALPLFLSGFIPALLLFVVYLLCNPPLPAPAQSTAPKSGARLWTDAITGAMRSQLVICGCLVSCAVIAALLCATGLPALLARLFHADARLMEMLFSGLLEGTRGVTLASQTTLPLRIQITLCAFFMHFGGLSVAAQSLCFLELDAPAKYIFHKFLFGLCAAILCYLLTPLFLPESIRAAMANANYAQNAVATGGILFVCLGSLLVAGVLGRVMGVGEGVVKS